MLSACTSLAMLKSRRRVVAPLASFLVFPLCILVHEFGHYSVALHYGWNARLFPTLVTYHADQTTDSERFNFLLAGPSVDAIQITAGIVLLFFCRGGQSRRAEVSYWIGVALALVSMKWAVTPMIASVLPTCDERQMSLLLGWHWLALPCVVAILGALALISLLKLHSHRGRLMELVPAVVFGGMGVIAWVKVIGPMVLRADAR
ncbi:MAG: hypothetical protein KDA61_12245 [Planctomycetales bacterium]|nr:hypothetical protein [Planctomycetales bacterium]